MPLLTALLLGLAAATPLAAQDLRLDVKEHTLENGVTVLVWERPSAGRIGARVFYRVDIAAERPGTIGLTHMLEHYLFMGSRHVGTTDWEAERPFAEAVERIGRELTDEKNRHRDCFRQRDVFAEVEADCRTPQIDSLQAALDAAFAEQQRFARGTDFDWIYQPAGGTGLTASTGRDWMKFDIDLPANRLELFMWAERSRVEHPVFRFFEPEREVVVDQIRRADNTPSGRFDRVVRSATYDAHPYGWAHWFSDLTRATREDHWQIFHEYFIPQNTVIVIVGDVRAEEVFKLAERYWGSWLPGRPSPRLRTVEPPPVAHKRVEVEAGAGPSFVLHVPMPAVGHPDAPVFEVLAELLGGDQGRLTRDLVDGRRIATRSTASAAVAKYPGHFAVRVEARSNADLGAIEEGVLAELAAIGRGVVGPGELDAAAARLVQSMARRLERIGPSAVAIGGMESIHHWAHLNELPRLWRAVTPADLARVANTYFAHELSVVGVLRRTQVAGASGAAGDRGVADAGAASGTESWGLRDMEPARAFGLDEVRRAADARALRSAARIGAAPAELAADATRPRGPGVRELAEAEPLPVAEAPWYAPPWMSDRRPSRFTAPPPVDHWRDFQFEPQPFRVPEPLDHLRRLPNGVTAIIVPDTLLPIAQVTALVDARSLNEPRGREGLAALTADLLRSGGADGRTREELDAEMRRLGARLSVDTDHNRTRLHMVAPASVAADAARLLASLVGRPTLDMAAFEAERDRHALRADRAADNALVQLGTLFHGTLYGDDHPLGRPPTGATVRGISHDDVRAFHAAHYRSHAVVFAVSGSVDPDQVARALAEGYGGGPAAGGAAAAPAMPAPTPPRGQHVVTREFDSRQGHVMFGHLGLEGLPDDHAALEIAHHILTGGAFISRMMEQLRTRTGITAAQYGIAEPGRGTRMPYAWRFSGSPETLAEGIRLALGEIRNLRDDGITPEEFEAARTSYIEGLIPAQYDTPHGTAERLAEKQLFGMYLYSSEGYLNYYAGDAAQVEALRRLTLDEVNRAARKYLDPDNLVIAVVGPLDAIGVVGTGD
jgi:predicted Zn-dependent peptidase